MKKGHEINFKDMDALVALGKWAFNQIPEGEYCSNCPLMSKIKDDFISAEEGYTFSYTCGLRPNILLHHHGGDRVYKSDSCPAKPEERNE